MQRAETLEKPKVELLPPGEQLAARGYPKFAEKDAEIIWLQGQLINARRERDYLLDLKRLNGDVNEGLEDLRRTLSQEAERLRAQNLQLQLDLQRLLLAYERATGERLDLSACSPPVPEKSAALEGSANRVWPYGSLQTAKTRAEIVEKDEAYATNKAYPKGRFSTPERGGV